MAHSTETMYWFPRPFAHVSFRRIGVMQPVRMRAKFYRLAVGEQSRAEVEQGRKVWVHTPEGLYPEYLDGSSRIKSAMPVPLYIAWDYYSLQQSGGLVYIHADKYSIILRLPHPLTWSTVHQDETSISFSSSTR